MFILCFAGEVRRPRIAEVHHVERAALRALFGLHVVPLKHGAEKRCVLLVGHFRALAFAVKFSAVCPKKVFHRVARLDYLLVLCPVPPGAVLAYSHHPLAATQDRPNKKVKTKGANAAPIATQPMMRHRWRITLRLVFLPI